MQNEYNIDKFHYKFPPDIKRHIRHILRKALTGIHCPYYLIKHLQRNEGFFLKYIFAVIAER